MTSKSLDTKPLYAFYHIPKTGGTTLMGHLFKNLEFDREVIPITMPWADNWRKKHGRSLPMERDRIDDCLMVQGHDIRHGIAEHFGRQGRYLTLIRDPLSHVVSRYNDYWDAHKYSFEEWFELFYNENGKYASGSQMAELGIFLRPPGDYNYKHGDWKKALDLCWYVGLTDSLTTDLDIIFTAMGVPTGEYTHYRKAGTDSKLREIGMDHAKHCKIRHPKYIDKTDPNIRKWILERLDPEEWEVYEYAKKLNAEHRKEKKK